MGATTATRADRVLEQRMANLKKANVMRTRMRLLREEIYDAGPVEGAAIAADVIAEGDSPIPLFRLMTAVQRLGATRTELMLRCVGCSGDLAVSSRMVTDRQRRELICQLYKFAEAWKDSHPEQEVHQ